MRRCKYIKEEIIGSGTYGTVYKAKEYDGIPSSTIREIDILLESQQQSHPNIVHLHEVIHRDGEISMVFEYIDYDLKRFHDEYAITVNSRQIMEAVLFCHQHRVFHRDIKPSNLLLTNSGIIKLADFGLSRTYSFPNRTYCHEVVTLWYRAPEVTLGVNNYITGVDIWSIGCIVAEMITGKILFPGDSEINQLFLIFRRFEPCKLMQYDSNADRQFLNFINLFSNEAKLTGLRSIRNSRSPVFYLKYISTGLNSTFIFHRFAYCDMIDVVVNIKSVLCKYSSHMFKYNTKVKNV